MARKQLIKGANAARVEARISRVPVDLGADLRGTPSIFGALKAMEADAQAALALPAATPVATPSAKPAAAPAPPRPAARSRKSRAKPPAKPKAEAAAATLRAPAADIIPVEAAVPRRPKPGRIGPSDFTAIERDAILRCCRDYRNHLPTYLLAVQKEVRIIDSVIVKCGGEVPE